MIDIHTHILQNVDHGAKTIEESIAILKKLADRGKVKKVFMTPHFFPGVGDLTTEKMLVEFEKLKTKIAKEKIAIEIYPGVEMQLTSDSLSQIKQKKVPTLNNSHYLLVELPYEKIPFYAPHYLFEIQQLGYIPIIAHFYRAGKPTLELAKEWKNRGILFQGASYSVSGTYGDWPKKLVIKMLEEKIIDFWASDIHNIKDTDKYAIDLFLEKFPQVKIDQKYFEQITETNPLKILRDEKI